MNEPRRISRRGLLRVASLAAVGASLAACGATPAATQPVAAGSDESPVDAAPVKLTWWEYPMWVGVTGQETAGMKQDDPDLAKYTPADWPNWAATEFATTNPGFTCAVETLTWEEGRSKLTVAATTGAGRPHLFLEDGPVILKFQTVDAMLPVELSGDDADDFFAGALAAGSREGKLYYRPWLAGSRFLLINRAIFKERGVENLIPTEGDRLWTYEQFLEAAKATTFKRGSEDVFGYTANFAHVAAHFWVDSFIWGYGGRIFDDAGTQVVIDSPESERGLQFVGDMALKDKVMPPGSAGLQETDLNNMFYQGRLAMMLGSHGSSRAIRMAIEDGTVPNADMIDIYPAMFPADTANQKKPAVYTVFMGFGQFDTGTDAEKATAAKFVEFLTNKDNAKAPLAANLLPTRKSSSDVFEGDDFMLYAMKAMDYGHADTLSPYYDAVNQFMNPMWQAVVSGERTAKEALTEAQEKSNAFIAEQQAKTAG
ncbi:MAG: extracellular solute-binding protein [Anaerolineae bacterium]